MAEVPLELRPTIDLAWLEAAARAEPLPHAYALWDLANLPAMVRFVSALDGERTVAYLLVWLGRPERPIVHWLGDTDRAQALIDRFPPPPFVATVPPEAEGVVRARFHRASTSPILLLWRDRGVLGEVDPERLVRRLAHDDRPELVRWSRRGDEPDRPDYAAIDPAAEPIWGAFERGRLVGVTRAAVRLPLVWVVAGVYVDPEARGHGLARRLVGTLIQEAEGAGAPTGLFVREDAGAARRVYEGLGFRPVGRRLWVEVPAGPAASAARQEEGAGPR